MTARMAPSRSSVRLPAGSGLGLAAGLWLGRFLSLVAACMLWAMAPIAHAHDASPPDAPRLATTGVIRVELPERYVVKAGQLGIIVPPAAPGETVGIFEIPLVVDANGSVSAPFDPALVRRTSDVDPKEVLAVVLVQYEYPWAIELNGEVLPPGSDGNMIAMGGGPLAALPAAVWVPAYDRWKSYALQAVPVALEREGSLLAGTLRFVRRVQLRGQADHAGDRDGRYWGLRHSHRRVMLDPPSIRPTGDFDFWIPEGVENSLLAVVEHNRFVEVPLPAWREGDRGIHIRFPETPVDELVRGDSLRLFDAGIDRTTGRPRPWAVPYMESNFRFLVFLERDGGRMFLWQMAPSSPPSDGSRDAEARAEELYGRLGVSALSAGLQRWKIAVGSWYVFELGGYNNMELVLGCRDALLDGFDLDGFGLTTVEVTKTPPTEDRVLDALDVRASQAAAWAWIQACRAADAAGKPRPPKPELKPDLKPELKPDHKPDHKSDPSLRAPHP